jgi:hypothetical protein
VLAEQLDQPPPAQHPVRNSCSKRRVRSLNTDTFRTLAAAVSLQAALDFRPRDHVAHAADLIPTGSEQRRRDFSDGMTASGVDSGARGRDQRERQVDADPVPQGQRMKP